MVFPGAIFTKEQKVRTRGWYVLGIHEGQLRVGQDQAPERPFGVLPAVPVSAPRASGPFLPLTLRAAACPCVLCARAPLVVAV